MAHIHCSCYHLAIELLGELPSQFVELGSEIDAVTAAGGVEFDKDKFVVDDSAIEVAIGECTSIPVVEGFFPVPLSVDGTVNLVLEHLFKPFVQVFAYISPTLLVTSSPGKIHPIARLLVSTVMELLSSLALVAFSYWEYF